jgi:subtilisin family serine protease
MVSSSIEVLDLDRAQALFGGYCGPADWTSHSPSAAQWGRETVSTRAVEEARGYVGYFDPSDTYQLRLADTSKVKIDLTDLRADVDLRVYDGYGRLIGSSDRAGTSSESLAGTLEPGSYQIEVSAYRWYDSSTYRLAVSSQPISSTPEDASPGQEPLPAPTGPSAGSPPASSDPNDQPLPPASDASVPFSDVPYYGGRNEWNLNSINAPEVWAQGYTGNEIVVAVLDTGVDLDHPDLRANLWVNEDEIPGNWLDDDSNGFIDDVGGWDFAGNDNDPNDRNGHGTHVAGTIAALRNGTGSTGVAPDALIMPVQVLGADGVGSLYDVAAGIRYAVDNGADIVNLSLGSGTYSSIVQSALTYAEQRGVFVTSAAGNRGGSAPEYPGRFSSSLTNVISVGAFDARGQVADFSNRVGASGAVQVNAPGVDIFSTYADDRFASFGGTSMAAPHVAGLAALALSANPDLSPSQLRDLIVDGADHRSSGSGFDRAIDAAYTVAEAAATVNAADSYRTSPTSSSTYTTLGTYGVRGVEYAVASGPLTLHAPVGAVPTFETTRGAVSPWFATSHVTRTASPETTRARDLVFARLLFGPSRLGAVRL